MSARIQGMRARTDRQQEGGKEMQCMQQGGIACGCGHMLALGAAPAVAKAAVDCSSGDEPPCQTIH